jgi:hypothetical protein
VRHLDRGAINKTQEAGGITQHVESWLDSGLNLKRDVAHFVPLTFFQKVNYF